MAAKAGVGYSEKADSRSAGEEAAKEALQRAGLTTCDVAVLYSTSKHDPAQFLAGVRSQIGPTSRVIGGSSMGIITADRLSYDGGYESGIAVLSAPGMKHTAVMEAGLANREPAVGKAIGEALRRSEVLGEGGALVLFDSVRSAPVGGMPQLNVGSELVRGVTEGLGGKWPKAVGGHGMIGDSGFSPTHQWLDDRIEHNSAIGVAIGGNVRLDVEVAHGCEPVSGYYTITK